MAFVKLPDDLKAIETARPDGRRVACEFRVFAGEVVAAAGAGEGLGEDNGRETLWLRSRRGERRFEFRDLPVRFDPGDVAGVIAALPDGRSDGPILAVANLTRDRRVDFVSREAELISDLAGYARDERRAGAVVAPLFGAVVKAAVAGALAVGGLMAAGSTIWADGAEAPAVSGLLGDALAAATIGDAPLVVGGAVGVVALAHFSIAALMRVRRRRRFLKSLLDTVWHASGEALGFAQDYADAFRPRANFETASPSEIMRRPSPRPALRAAPSDRPASPRGAQRR